MVIGRGRHREHLQPTFCTTKKKGPLPVTSLSSKGPTRADIVQRPVAHAHILPDMASSGPSRD